MLKKLLTFFKRIFAPVNLSDITDEDMEEMERKGRIW